MDPNSGLFKSGETAPPEANRYYVGKLVSLDGDEYRVLAIDNVRGRGEIVLRATSAVDRAKLPPTLAEIDRPLNRHERRKASRKQRLASKRLDHLARLAPVLAAATRDITEEEK